MVDGSICLELEDDMMTVKGGEHPVVPGEKAAKNSEFEGHGFFEASSMRKVNGKYCYVYSSSLSHELCYAYSNYPDRDFHYGGTLISIGDIGYKGNTKPLNYLGNTHGGMAKINGQWYIFYHRQINRTKCCRQGSAAKLTIHEDGTIEQAEVTSCGLSDQPLSGKGCYEARIACNLSGKDGIISSDKAVKKDKKKLYPYFTKSGEDRERDGDQYIANMKNGSWCAFKYFAFDGDESTIRISVRTEKDGLVTVQTSPNGNPATKIEVKASSDWQDYTAECRFPAGANALYFTVRSDTCIDFRSFEIR